MTLTAQSLPSAILTHRRVLFLDGNLYFNVDRLLDDDYESKFAAKSSTADGLSIEALRTLNTPKPRGRYNTLEQTGPELILTRNSGDEKTLGLSTVIKSFGPDSDVFWTEQPYPPFPIGKRFEMYRHPRGATTRTFHRSFSQGDMNYALLDNQVISWMKNPEGLPYQIGFFNTDPVMNEALGIDGITRLDGETRLFASGKRVWFTTKEDAQLACSGSW